MIYSCLKHDIRDYEKQAVSDLGRQIDLLVATQRRGAKAMSLADPRRDPCWP